MWSIVGVPDRLVAQSKCKLQCSRNLVSATDLRASPQRRARRVRCDSPLAVVWNPYLFLFCRRVHTVRFRAASARDGIPESAC
eukprot:10423775-Lingulodinium_polyedra.AAC.1